MYEGLRMAGLILNQTDPAGDVSRETNLDELRRHLTVPVLGRLPFLEDLSGETLLRAAETGIDIGLIMKSLGG
jgi:dethiobiotin synthetase